MTQKTALLIGLEPSLIDLSGFPGLSADKVRAGLQGDQQRLATLGYELDICLTDTGETAEEVVMNVLKSKRFDCVVIGAGIRTSPTYFFLFERLLNVVHEHAPNARICFNTKPSDTAEAVQRWV